MNERRAASSIVAAVLAVGIPSAPAAASPPDWVKVGSYSPPTIRSSPAMVTNPGGGTMLFGGSTPTMINGSGLAKDTWTFGGTRWTEHRPSPSPSPRAGAAAAYDAARDEVVLFGGAGGTGVLADTWTWDGEAWTEEHPAHSPTARYAGAAAYDPAAAKVVLFGGAASAVVASVSLADTWTWDGADWTQEITPLAPPPRSSFGFADGSATSKPVLFGGVANAVLAAVYLADTWTWDGPNHTWLPQAVVGPEPRAGVQLAYDRKLGKAVAIGGYAFGADVKPNGFDTQLDYADTWTWDGSGWTKLIAAAPTGARWSGGMAFDPTTSRIELFGGLIAGKGWGNDTWAFDGTTWTREDLTAPDELQNAMLAREPGGTAILFGGQTEYGGYSQDTWRWDGADWQLLTPAHSPLPRGMGSLAFDPANGNTVLFGGNVDTYGYPGPRQIYAASDTWTWDGTDWTQQQPATSPPKRYYASAVYDAARGEVVLFGGSAGGSGLADTWTWDGTTWTKESPATSPPERFAAALAYDPATETVVLYGGSMSNSAGWLDDTWTWDGTDWTEQQPIDPPPGRAYAAMAYDPGMAAPILFGGCSSCYGSTTYDETWAWDGASWTELAPDTVPYERTNAAALGGDEANPLLLFGGRRRAACCVYDTGTEFLNDLWAFDPPSGP